MVKHEVRTDDGQRLVVQRNEDGSVLLAVGKTDVKAAYLSRDEAFVLAAFLRSAK